MQFTKLIPVAVLALAVACSDSDTATSPTSVPGPLFAVAPATYPGTLNTANTPSGAHVQSGSIGCTVNANLSISCSSYQIAGVGNTNAVVSLTANYTATINCTNHGGNTVEVHSASFSAGGSTQLTSSRNGRMSVPTQSASPFSAPQVCPNPNWTPSIAPGTLVLTSFTYTLTFAGFSSPAVSISQS